MARLQQQSGTPGPPADVDVLAGYADELNYRDLMVIMGKTKRTIYSWLNDGEIPAFHVGNRWIIHKAQLLEKLRQTSNQSIAEGQRSNTRPRLS